ncbi:MAG: STAS domain-containing protein [Actinobacteria bacterium]|nr:MAG: STAS domain-containing protein [Actinomycetota bacterium]
MLATTFLASVSTTGEETFIVCRGEFDMAVVDRYRSAADEAFRGDPRHIHLDCSAVTFIDSLGLRALMHTAMRCRDAGILMTIDMSPQMRRLLDTVGATALFTLAP